MSFFQNALDYLGWSSDHTGDTDEYPEDDFEETAEPRERFDRREPGVTRLVPRDRAEFAGLMIVRADPRDFDQATFVADEIKRRRPVILNLQNVAEPEAKRIRDFIAGVTYGLNGYMRRIADWVFVCAPFDMPVERLLLDSMRAGDARYEDRDHRSLQDL